jgi:hypothetical protein
MEGGELEDILTWPPELLYQYEGHGRGRRSGHNMKPKLASGSRHACGIYDEEGRTKRGAVAPTERALWG